MTTQKDIDSIFEKSKDKFLNKAEIEAIQDKLKVESKWGPIKKAGISALPAGNATVAFKSMNNILKENGIFLVPVGELECFIKEVGGHGPEWVNNVLEKYPDFSDEVYSSIISFVKELNL